MTPLREKEQVSYKYAQIKTDLSIKILDGTFTPNERIPSLNEITEQYGVSKITARRVLNDLVAEGLVYAVRGKGSFVADLSSYPNIEKQTALQNIGVVFEHAYDAFMSDTIRGIDEKTFDAGVHINLCLSNDSYQREAEILKRLVRQGTKQILLFMVLSDNENELNPNLPLYLKLQEKGSIRLLLIDCYLPHVPIPSISWDDFGGMRSLVQHFHTRGCRKLTYLTRSNNAFSMAMRMEGFKQGLLEQNLPYAPERIIRVSKRDTQSHRKSAKKAMVEYLSKKPKIDAILCSDEEMAAGVFDAFEQLGNYNPNSFPIGGFGNPKSRFLLNVHPYVLLEQNTYELGRKAAEALLRYSTIGKLAPDSQGSLLRQTLPVPITEI